MITMIDWASFISGFVVGWLSLIAAAAYVIIKTDSGDRFDKRLEDLEGSE